MKCVECLKKLTNEERMYNRGTCPHCGHRGSNAATIVDTLMVPTVVYSLWERILKRLGVKIEAQ